MANTKISALTAATTPVAGTEVLPIVQSSTTVNVSIANLTAGRAVATGALTVTGAATVSTTLGVTGATTLSSTVATGALTVTGAATVSTTLAVTGATTLTSGTISTTPSNSTDIANKAYVDNVAQGLDTKASVVAATTANITLIGTQTIDGIVLVAADRVLVKNQTAQADNGIYLCAAGAWTRTTDMDTWAEVPGAYVFVETGTTLFDTGWVCTSNAGGTIGTTAIVWAQFSGAGSGVSSITFGTTGLTPSTATTGAVTVAGTLAVLNGGTGVTTSTGSGATVLSTSPVLVTPLLGTPTSGVLTTCTGYTTANLSGTITNAQLANSTTTINGTSIALGASGTVTAAANTLTGTTLNSTVVTSSLTALGTIATGVWNGTIITGTYGGTGVNNGAKTITLGGNLTTSGAFNTTVTTTAATSVTLPTSGTIMSSVTALSGAVTGTPSITTYLRGDGTWASVSGSGTVNSGTAYELAYYAASGTAVSTLGSLGTNGQVLTSGGAGVAPTWTTISAGSQATATALGTVYAKQTTGGGTPFLTAFGYNAGASTTGATCTAIGTQALFSNTSGNQNTAVGYQALYSNSLSTGVSLTAVGWQAGYSYNSSGSNQAQVFIGASAGYYNVSGIDNSYVGGYAGYYQTGSYNTALGSGALLGASGTSTGTNNTAIGYQALYSTTSGANNTSYGYRAGYQVSTGTDNVLLGYGAGYAGFGNNLVTGSNNIIIGTSSPSVSSTTYEIIIGNGVNGRGGSTGVISPAGGGVFQGNNSATWSVSSDQRLKKNIVDNTIGLEQINGIRVRNFEYRTENEITELPKNQAIDKQGVQLGAIAQELQQVLPDCVKEETTGVLSVDSSNLTWHMINAIKELSAKVTALEARLGA